MSETFANMKLWPQWLVWKIEKRQNKLGDWVDTKVPYSPNTLMLASSTDPTHWSSYSNAMAVISTGAFNGVGFVFTKNDPFFFVDIDDALLPSGQWSPLALEICQHFAGAAVEVSQSGTGLHICGLTHKPIEHRSRPSTGAALELYTHSRFMAFTETGAIGSDAFDGSAKLQEFINIYGFTRTAAELAAKTAEWTTEPCEGWVGTSDDDELIRRALRSGANSAAERLGNAVSFKELWTGDVDALAKKWPSARDAFDRSEAEASLAGKLAFWTGKDCARMERLMRKSALVREKWDSHPTYLDVTVTKAAGFCSAVYVEKPKAPPPPPPPPIEESLVPAGFVMRNGADRAILPLDQLERFKGCVYVASENKVLEPSGRLYDRQRFDIVFGGGDFVIDVLGKKTSPSAWEAFTQSHNFKCPTVDKLCFRPSRPFAELITEGGYVMANFYSAPDTKARAGDASRFLQFMAKLLPHDRDRDILMHYMASCVQNIGKKFQWWPVIQGVEGNGKSILLRIMTHCIGSRYVHLPNVHKMVKGSANFNGWMRFKLFIGMEEIYTGKRREFLDELKATITNDKIPVEGKGVEEAVEDNFANGMMLTNHRDGVPIKDADRRYGIFYSAQQSPEDLLRFGMTSGYFQDFYDWFKGEGIYSGDGAGVEVINHYLLNMPLQAELDPARGMQRAPVTSSTKEAIVNSRGMAEQTIMEAVEEGRIGFLGGFVSSFHLNLLLEKNRIIIPHAKRREMMETLGYTTHPLLTNGRSPRAIGCDGNTKPYIYLRDGHLALNFDQPAKVVVAYSQAQDVSGLQESGAA